MQLVCTGVFGIWLIMLQNKGVFWSLGRSETFIRVWRVFLLENFSWVWASCPTITEDESSAFLVQAILFLLLNIQACFKSDFKGGWISVPPPIYFCFLFDLQRGYQQWLVPLIFVQQNWLPSNILKILKTMIKFGHMYDCPTLTFVLKNKTKQTMQNLNWIIIIW